MPILFGGAVLTVAGVALTAAGFVVGVNDAVEHRDLEPGTMQTQRSSPASGLLLAGAISITMGVVLVVSGALAHRTTTSLRTR